MGTHFFAAYPQGGMGRPDQRTSGKSTASSAIWVLKLMEADSDWRRTPALSRRTISLSPLRL